MTTTTLTTPTETPANRLVRKIRLRALFFFALALVAGIGAVFMVKLYMDRSRAAVVAAPLPTRDVICAAADVPIGTQLDRVHLTAVRWPAQDVPPGSFAKIEEVVGRSLQQSVVAGEPILAGRLADPDRGRGMAAILEPGHRAMAVKVDQFIGVAGFVQPGDFVDVITTMKPDEERDVARIAKMILQNIRVLAVGQQLATEGSKPVTVQVVTLDVTPEQAEKLALASQHGKVQLTMRSRIDQENIATTGVTPQMLLASDEGERKAAAAPAAEAPRPAVAQAPPPRRSSATHRTRARTASAASAAPAEQRPVVEILRGGKVEERALRPSADAK